MLSSSANHALHCCITHTQTRKSSQEMLASAASEELFCEGVMTFDYVYYV